MTSHQDNKHNSFYTTTNANSASIGDTNNCKQQDNAAKAKKFLITAVSMIWTGLKRFCFAFGFMALISIVIWTIIISRLTISSAPIALPDQMVLFLKLDKPINETQNISPFENPFEEPAPTFYGLLKTMRQATKDDRVKGIVLRMEAPALSLSQVQEFRNSIQSFRDAGKFAYIYAPSYGGGGVGGLGQIYLASAFDQRWMHPMGVVSIDGLRIEMPFAREALEKIGAKPEFYQRKSYKTAYESLTHSAMTSANREELKALVNVIRSELVNDIPAELDMTEDQFDALVDFGLFTGVQAHENGLISHLNYVDELIANVAHAITGNKDASLDFIVPIRTYAAAVPDRVVKQHKVALVHVSGAIVSSDDSGYGDVAAADDIATAIWSVVDDPFISSILVRVDSPGGSPVASDTILRALNKAKENGKEIIVSMGSTAASGGYWVASNANYIFAMPTTITGSIGVVGGKISTQGVWPKLGVNWDKSIAWGDNAGMWSPVTPFTKGQADRVNMMLDNVYDNFIQRVASGRNLTPEKVEQIAQGRIWPGSLAKDNGLVDELGGMEDALSYIAKRLGVSSIDALQVVQIPEELSPIEKILKLLSDKGLVFQALKMQVNIAQIIEPLIDSRIIKDMSSLSSEQPYYIYETVEIK